jgi:hypothetical protein
VAYQTSNCRSPDCPLRLPTCSRRHLLHVRTHASSHVCGSVPPFAEKPWSQRGLNVCTCVCTYVREIVETRCFVIGYVRCVFAYVRPKSAIPTNFREHYFGERYFGECSVQTPPGGMGVVTVLPRMLSHFCGACSDGMKHRNMLLHLRGGCWDRAGCISNNIETPDGMSFMTARPQVLSPSCDGMEHNRRCCQISGMDVVTALDAETIVSISPDGVGVMSVWSRMLATCHVVWMDVVTGWTCRDSHKPTSDGMGVCKVLANDAGTPPG